MNNFGIGDTQVDHSLLIPRIYAMLKENGCFMELSRASLPAFDHIGFGKAGNQSIVIAEDTAIELGAPSRGSLSLLLLSQVSTPENSFLKIPEKDFRLRKIA